MYGSLGVIGEPFKPTIRSDNVTNRGTDRVNETRMRRRRPEPRLMDNHTFESDTSFKRARNLSRRICEEQC